ncbi:MAG TPA: PLP-dependent cysteine synthase family protein [Nitriliruptorales bacterium]
MGLASSILDVVGGTPLLELSRLVEAHGLDGRILLKLEYLNPGFSKKDRIAREMVVEARQDGRLVDGQTVVELTSGNTGTGLALVCAALGHPLVVVMSAGNSVERARMMAALGAEVVLVEQAPGSPRGQVSGDDLALVEERTQKIMAERGAFRADQFRLEANPRAHERTTGPELWEQSGGLVDVFADFVGSGGSFVGVARYLRRVNPDVRTYAVEPATAAVLAGAEVTDPNHRIQGGGYSMGELPLFDPSLVTGYLQVTDDEAVGIARDAARLEGVFAGFSTGANIAAAMALLRGPEAGATVAVLACDSGLKYLSTDLYP